MSILSRNARCTFTLFAMSNVYPSELKWRWVLPDGTRILIRPIRAEDSRIEQEFVRALSNEAKYFRFMGGLNELSPGMLKRFTDIDYDREMALIALITEQAEEKEIAVARYVTEPDGTSCEFAIVVADAWQHRHIGTTLMICLMQAAHSRGLQVMNGFVLANNRKMLNMMSALGFQILRLEDDPRLEKVSRRLDLDTLPALPAEVRPVA